MSLEFLDPSLAMVGMRAGTPPSTTRTSSPAGGASTVNLLINSNNASPRSHPAPLPVVEPTASLQAIIAASRVPQWVPEPTQNPGKRKLDDAEAGGDPQSKMRRIAKDELPTVQSQRVMPMTTVICLHAAVAQKSYGTEKRFLCPPPVVHIDGPVWHMRSQQLSMSVVSESGERSFDQKAHLDNNMSASFKFLHVTGTAKAKSFNLALEIAEPPHSADDHSISAHARTWASFESAPVTIISKPSKKTAKTRNIASCILEGGPVSLFNRINSQTVRTKYMTIDRDSQLCASNVSWSAFNVNVLHRPPGPPVAGPQPVTYGCQIILTDTQTGTSTPPLVIRKVDKGRVSPEDGGPVSQMQKIALQRVNEDGSRNYLSALGPTGTPSITAPASPGGTPQGGSHPLVFGSPRVRDEIQDGLHILSDEVDDYLCWTIVGISKFQYTFFDAFGHNNSVPDAPITPFPTLFTSPIYRAVNNTIELTVSNFFYEDSTTKNITPLDVYLGNLGPLRHRVYQPGPPGPLTNVAHHIGPREVEDPSGSGYVPTGPVHSIVVVEMPQIEDVIKALEQDALPANQNPPSEDGPASENDTTSPSAQAKNDDAVAPGRVSLSGRSLPILFIRASDGVGYHSGRTITCELFPPQGVDLHGNSLGPGIDQGWQGHTPDVALPPGAGYTLRVI